MRIGIIAPLEMRVPPVGYGGTELVVSLLTEELVQRGHRMTLFASGDSVTSAELVPGSPEFLRGKPREKAVFNLRNVVNCLERAAEFDIIHNHTVLEGLSTAGLTATPMLTTLHGDLKNDWRQLFMEYRGWYNTISHSAKRLLPKKNRFAGVVYNAIDVATYPFNGASRDDTLLFLSRISHEKGPHVAIEVARKLGARLVIAGNIDTPDEPYFKEMVLPRIDGDQIKFIGEADATVKRELMASACCLVAPILWDEPFGLFMAEAMACGTPVVVFNRGSAPEVVADKVTGFVVSTIDEMVEAIRHTGEIDKTACRRHVEERFDAPRMCQDYLQAYDAVLNNRDLSAEVELEAIATGGQSR